MEYKLKEPRGDRRHWEIYWTTEVDSGSLYQEGILLAKRMKRKQSRSSVVGLQDNQMSLT